MPHIPSSTSKDTHSFLYFTPPGVPMKLSIIPIQSNPCEIYCSGPDEIIAHTAHFSARTRFSQSLWRQWSVCSSVQQTGLIRWTWRKNNEGGCPCQKLRCQQSQNPHAHFRLYSMRNGLSVPRNPIVVSGPWIRLRCPIDRQLNTMMPSIR